MKSTSIAISLLLAALTLTGCAVTNETSLLIGKSRPQTLPEQVKLYVKAPAKYESIAIISADAAHAFMSKQGLQDASIANLKKEAAKVGANGILLNDVGDFNVGSVGVVTGSQTVATGVSTAHTGKKATGTAIFVIEE